MEVLKNFGFEPVLFLAQIVNFFILLWILKKFLYSPLLNTLKNRQKEVEEGIQKTEQARLLLEKTQKEEKEILKKAQAESRNFIEDAKKQAETIVKNSEVHARKQTEKMVEEARLQIQRDTKEAEARLTRHISILATDFLKKSLQEIVDEDDQEAIMKRALKKIKKAD